MTLLWVHLYGRHTDSLSNHMRQTQSISSDYAIRWWLQRRLSPPSLNPVSLLR
jgi:hypothetical protein